MRLIRLKVAVLKKIITKTRKIENTKTTRGFALIGILEGWNTLFKGKTPN